MFAYSERVACRDMETAKSPVDHSLLLGFLSINKWITSILECQVLSSWTVASWDLEGNAPSHTVSSAMHTSSLDPKEVRFLLGMTVEDEVACQTCFFLTSSLTDCLTVCDDSWFITLGFHFPSSRVLFLLFFLSLDIFISVSLFLSSSRFPSFPIFLPFLYLLLSFDIFSLSFFLSLYSFPLFFVLYLFLFLSFSACHSFDLFFIFLHSFLYF
jgi:hypothetical protein